MAGPNYAWKAVWWVTHVGLTPVQAWISVADAVWTSVKTVLDTWKNLLKTLVYPFSNETWKPKWKEDYKKTWWKEWFSGRQKKHWDNYIAPFKWDGMKAPLLAKATWGITHFATAIPTNAVMTALDATYSAIKTPFSILKNIWKTVIYPFTNETWKPTFGKDLKAIWWKEKWFVARTRDSWINTFDVIPKKGNRWKKKIENDDLEDDFWEEENGAKTIEQSKIIESKNEEGKKEESKNEKNKSHEKVEKEQKDGKQNEQKNEKESKPENKTEEKEKKNENEGKKENEKENANEDGLKKDSIITRKIIKENPDTIFVFWDNVEAKKADAESIAQKWDNEEILAKSWWQAKEMRPAIKDWKKDIENSIWIPTMNGFWKHMTDHEFNENKKVIDDAISEIKKAAKWKKIHIPFDTKKNQYNIWTGIADLKNKAPKTFKYLQEELKKLESK